MRMGSLFDGAGTCCFAAELCGIQPVWSSEIEKFPLEVTAKRFPKVKQLGDITKINGAEIEPVDIITFGSPCQDLSIAGKREGLDGERSGLFMEAIRIIKEMRNATANEFPRYVVWENVPGAYSSNQGEDFRTVLEEIVKVKDEAAVIPRPSRGGGKSSCWNGAGYILGRGYSLAWRTLDAQFWGVPQRRRRIYLVADFRGERADKILFERNGLSRNFKTGSKAWKGTADTAETCPNNSGQCYDARGNGNGTIAPTITGDHENRVTDYTAVVVYNEETITNKTNASNPKDGDPSHTLCATGAARALLVVGADMYNQTTTGVKSLTLRAKSGDSDHVPCVITCYAIGNGQADQTGLHKLVGALNCMHDQQAVLLCYCLQGNGIDRTDKSGCNGKGVTEGVSYTLNTTDRHAVCVCREGSKELKMVNLIVRRLTPTECARLQGMPDWWASDIEHTDSPEYKMWGNGMALPNILYVMEGLKEFAEEAA